MTELIKNSRPYAKKLLAVMGALFAVGFIWLGLALFRAVGTGDGIYLGPIVFFACVFFAVIAWIVFAIGQDNRKAPKHRKPTWSTRRGQTNEYTT